MCKNHFVHLNTLHKAIDHYDNVHKSLYGLNHVAKGNLMTKTLCTNNFEHSHYLYKTL